MMRLACCVLFCFFVGTYAAGPGRMRGPKGPKVATCVIRNENLEGTIVLQQIDSQKVSVTGQITGLAPGKHGFHVHQFGDLRNGCTSAGPHYNPFGHDHGAPTDQVRHVGDLGNIVADDTGIANINIQDSQLRLCGPLSILGRAIVVHEREDDLGRGGNDESKKTGNAGSRIGCCIIGIAQQS